MTFWLIQPRDPLIFRDGRPFTADPGARAVSLPFPYPSTLAGAARTLSVSGHRQQHFDEQLVEQLLAKSLRGPLLVSLNENGTFKDFFVPAPADALMLRVKDKPQSALRQWLHPLALPAGVEIDFRELPYLVGPSHPRPDKVHPQAPSFWRWDVFEKWLEAPVNEELIPQMDALGLQRLPREYRVHVRMNAETQTVDPGGLFVTGGLEFVNAPIANGRPQIEQTTEFAFVVDTDAELSSSWGFLGGERRVVQWKPIAQGSFPACPPQVAQAIAEQRACRLILLTPAYFEEGFLPGWLQERYKFDIVASAIRRYQVVSGWDYKEGKPKPTRRLVPAGSVFFLKDIQDVDEFIASVWMSNVSDGAQNRRDGFGLAVLGAWDGQIAEMEVSDA